MKYNIIKIFDWVLWISSVLSCPNFANVVKINATGSKINGSTSLHHFTFGLIEEIRDF